MARKKNEESVKEVWDKLLEEEKEKIYKELEEAASKVEPYSMDDVIKSLDKAFEGFSERMDELCKSFADIFCGEEQEEEKMEPTSKQVINGVNAVEIYQEPVCESTRLTLKNNDDTFEIEINGYEAYEFFRRLIFNDHNCNGVRKENEYLADEIVALRRENKLLKTENQHLREDIMRAKDELHSIKLEKKIKENSVFGMGGAEADATIVIDHGNILKENEYLRSEVNSLREEISRCNKVNEDLGSNAIELEKRMQMYKQAQTQKIKALKKELAFEKAVNETPEKPLTRAGILDQAKKCVCGQREQDYGTPESNFQLIADLWNEYLFPSFLPIDKPVISATDVAMMMGLMKIARIRNGGGTGDSFVDLAGYAACGGEINARRKQTEEPVSKGK